MSAARVLEIGDPSKITTDLSGAIGVGSHLTPEQVIRLITEKRLDHVVQKDGLAFDTEMAVARVMKNTLGVFLDNPIQTILGLTDAESSHLPNFHLNASVADKKSDAMNQFEEFLSSIRGLRSAREHALMIADELYSNGAKLAYEPRSLKKSSRLVHPDQRVEFFARVDAQRLIIGVRDTFGLLEFQQVLSRIALCFDNGIGESIRQGHGGAGIGSFMVFNAAVSYYAGVERGRRTVVCVALPLGFQSDEAAGLSKNIHLATD